MNRRDSFKRSRMGSIQRGDSFNIKRDETIKEDTYNDIYSSLFDKDASEEGNQDIRHRSTKIICTLGHKTKEVEPIRRMIEKGMDVARLNMNYFEINEQQEIITNIKEASKLAKKDVAIMVDLKGPLIRTLGFEGMKYSVPVLTGQEIRIATPGMGIQGNEEVFVIDYEHIDQKLRVGDRLLVDYGGVVLTVIGFETEEAFLKRQKYHQILDKHGPMPPSDSHYDKGHINSHHPKSNIKEGNFLHLHCN